MKKPLMILLVAMLATGCATVDKYLLPAANVGVAAASIGPCRAELVDYLPAGEIYKVAPDLELLDDVAKKLKRAVDTRGESVTFKGALNITSDLDLATAKSDIEAAFGVVNTVAVQYALTTDTVNPTLLDCRSQITAGWESLTENTGAVKAAEMLKTLAPYAKLLPLLLKNEGVTKHG